MRSTFGALASSTAIVTFNRETVSDEFSSRAWPFDDQLNQLLSLIYSAHPSQPTPPPRRATDGTRAMRNPILMLIMLLLWMAPTLAQAEATPPGTLDAAADHTRLLQLLGIESLRRGADGEPNSPFAANYDESRANENLHSLPDPLKGADGEAVTQPDEWWAKRRPEIVEQFDREIYGRVPDGLPAVSWELRGTVKSTIAARPVARHEVAGLVEAAGYPQLRVEMQLSLTLPENAPGPAPVILALAFDPAFYARLRERFSEEQLQGFNGDGPSWQEQLINRGWGFAELIATSVQADSGDGLAAGIIGLGNRGRPRRLDDWGALRAWAWGASRALDFLATVEAVDANRVGITGHSRFGKAALVAMAYDPRFATALISSSGEGGAKLWRRNFGEQIGNIAGSGEYHWVAGNFLKYAGPLTANDLPIDAHELIALCAPRPVFISSGTEGDQWVDPRGMFMATVHAGPVYELLGRDGLGTKNFPPTGTPLVDGDLAWRQHELGHTPGPNWKYFIEFAERYFK